MSELPRGGWPSMSELPRGGGLLVDGAGGGAVMTVGNSSLIFVLRFGISLSTSSRVGLSFISFLTSSLGKPPIDSSPASWAAFPER